jgi:hypothetical protein
MVLALQLDNVYREFILWRAKKTRWQVRTSHLCTELSCQHDFPLPGFAPAGEALFFREKGPKPVTPRLALLRRRTMEDEGSPGFAFMEKARSLTFSTHSVTFFELSNLTNSVI